MSDRDEMQVYELSSDSQFQIDVPDFGVSEPFALPRCLVHAGARASESLDIKVPHSVFRTDDIQVL